MLAEMTNDVAIGLFTGYFWSPHAELLGAKWTLTLPKDGADQALAAAKHLHATTGQVTLSQTDRRVTATWQGKQTSQNRNYWPYGKTPIMAVAFLVRGDVVTRCGAYLATTVTSGYPKKDSPESVLMFVACAGLGIGWQWNGLCIEPQASDELTTAIERYAP